LPEVLQAVKPFEDIQGKPIPVIAAGGIYTGEDIHQILSAGASGVQMGTRFVTTHECDASSKFKQTYLDAHKDDLLIINSPVGLPGRVIRNGFIESINRGEKAPYKCPYHCIHTCDFKNSPYCIANALINAKRGNLKAGFAFAGANAYRADKIISVAELFDALIKEYQTARFGVPNPQPALT
jgi:nitronate monooxygenase